MKVGFWWLSELTPETEEKAASSAVWHFPSVGTVDLRLRQV